MRPLIVQPHAAAVLAAAILCLLAPRACCDCQLAFTVNPDLSRLSLGGGLTDPLVQPLQIVHPDVLVGLQGAAAALLPGGCPGSASALLQQLDGAIFSSTAELGPLQLYPDSIKASSLLAAACWQQPGGWAVAGGM
jgi:hypothetical protein